MKWLMTKSAAVALTVLLMGSVFGTWGKADARDKGVLIIGHSTPMPTLEPSSAGGGNPTHLCRNVFQGLLRYKFNSYELEGDLAKSWSVSKDGLVYTFKLRDNIKWQKGFGGVTANDVKFSFDRIMDPKTQSMYLGEFKGMIKEVKVIDDLTVEVHLKDRNVTFLHRVARPVPVAIVSQKAVERYGQDFGRNVIGSGPYMLESISREQVVLTANRDYFEGAPKIEKVIYRVIPDLDVLAMSLIKGEVDFTWSFPTDPALVERIRAGGVKTSLLNHGGVFYLTPNPRVEPLGDVRVRRAIAHAIDKDAIAKYVMLPGTTDRLDSPVPKGYFGHTEEGLWRYNYDPKKAKELLAEAGYPNGFDVTLDSINSGMYIPVHTTLQEQLTKVGIRVKLDIADNPSHTKKMTGGTGSLLLYQPQYLPDANAPFTELFYGPSAPPGRNLSRYNRLDKQIEEARREMDPAKRLKMYQEMQKTFMEDLPAIPLFNFTQVLAYGPNVIAKFPEKDPMTGVDWTLMRMKE